MTKLDEFRQADTEIQVTQEMIDAGIAVLSFWLDEHVPESWYLANERVLVEVFEQMAKRCPTIHSKPNPQGSSIRR